MRRPGWRSRDPWCLHWAGECGLCTKRSLDVTGMISPRQVQIVERLAAGQTHVEIAAAMYLDATTVYKHMDRVKTLLGARTRPQLVDTAWRLGLLRA